MDFETEKIEEVTVVNLDLDVIDAGNVTEFKTNMFKIIETANKIIINMASVGFVDSSGCGAFLSCLRRLNSSGGDLKLYGVQKSVMTVFELVRMQHIINIFNTKQEAINAF